MIRSISLPPQKPYGVSRSAVGWLVWALFCSFAPLLPLSAQLAQVPTIRTVAGTASQGYAAGQDGGPATSAELNLPQGAAVDRAGNLYIADTSNHLVRRVDRGTGILSTVAGTGVQGFFGDGGLATAAQLNSPTAVTLDSAGNLYIADANNNRVRRVAAGTQIITTYAGNGTRGDAGDGGSATAAQLDRPAGLAVSSGGTLYIADTDYCIRSVSSSGQISTAAGSCGTFLPDAPSNVALDAAGTLYYPSSQANCVLKGSGSNVTVVAGTCGSSGAYSGDGGAATSAKLSSPEAVALDAQGNIYIVDASNNAIRKVTASTGIITTVSGSTGLSGFSGDNGQASSARLATPNSVAVDGDGNLYIADTTNNRIREVASTSGSLRFPLTAIGSTSPAETLLLQPTQSLTITSVSVAASQGSVSEFTAGLSGCALNAALTPASLCTITVKFTPGYPGERAVPLTVVTSQGTMTFGLSGQGQGPLAALTPGIIATIAGNGAAGSAGDGQAATSAEIYHPNAVAVDNAGNLYIADYFNNRVREVLAATGKITTVAGNGTAGSYGDGAAATSAELMKPTGVALDAAGNLYIAGSQDYRVRKVAAATGIITTVAGTGTQEGAASGDGGLATQTAIGDTFGVVVDAAGDLYLTDSTKGSIRKVTAATGILTTVATGFQTPYGVAVDGAGNVYVADYGVHTISKVTAPTGVVTTVAGNGTAGFQGDGSAATGAELNSPFNVAVDAAGNLYISDSGNNRIRKVDAATGLIRTIAGNGNAGYGGDGGPASSTGLNEQFGIGLDSAGNVYIADLLNNRIRKVTVANTALSFASTAVGGTSSDSPQPVTLDNSGNAALSLSVPSSGSNPSASADFSLYTGSATTCPVETSSSTAGTLPVGASCALGYSFTPQTAGAHSESSTLSDTSLNTASSQQVALSGTATAGTPFVTVQYTKIVYGNSPEVFGDIQYSGASPTGKVTFELNSDASLIMTAGCYDLGGRHCSATYSATVLPPGSYQVLLTEAQDSNYQQVSGTGSLSVTAPTDSVTVATLPPIVYGTSSDTLSASVSYNGGSYAPQGGLSFSIDGGPAIAATCTGSSSPLSCSATVSTAALSAGSHAVTATEAAYGYYATIATGGGTLTVNPATPTLTAAVQPTPIVYGTSTVALSASLGYPAGAVAPTGAVSFRIDSGAAVTGSCTGTSSPLSCAPGNPYPAASLAAGTSHTVTVTIAAGGNYTSQTATTPLTVSQATPAVSVTVQPASIVYGTSTVALSAGITYPTGSAAPTGRVTFNIDGGASITASCTGTSSPLTCVSSNAYPSAGLAAGSHTVNVSVAADGNYTAQSATTPLAVTQGTPTVAVTPPAAVGYGTVSTILTATVAYTGSAAPTKGLTLQVGNGTPVSASCSPGGSSSGSPSTCTATYPTASLVPGSYTISATEAADGNYTAASGSGTLTVAKATPTITASSVSAIAGSAVTLTAQVAFPAAAATPPTGALQFFLDGTRAVTGLCAGSTTPLTCTASFDTSVLSLGPHTLSASTSADTNFVSASTTSTGGSGTLTLVSAGIPLCTLSLQSQAASLTVAVAAGCTDASGRSLPTTINWGGPGTATANGFTYQNAGTYTVTLSATNSSGSSTAAQSVTLTGAIPIHAGGATTGVTATSTPTTQTLTVTFACTSVSVLLPGQAVQSALPSAYGISCAPVTLPLTSAPQAVPIVVQTTGGVMAKQVQPLTGGTGGTGAPPIRLAALGLCCLAVFLRKARRLRQTLAGAGSLLVCVILTSCGGSFTPPAVTPTPGGTYFVTVTELVTPAPNPPLTNFVQTSLIVQLQVK